MSFSKATIELNEHEVAAIITRYYLQRGISIENVKIHAKEHYEDHIRGAAKRPAFDKVTADINIDHLQKAVE